MTLVTGPSADATLLTEILHSESLERILAEDPRQQENITRIEARASDLPQLFGSRGGNDRIIKHSQKLMTTLTQTDTGAMVQSRTAARVP